jgi:hypothetical protein
MSKCGAEVLRCDIDFCPAIRFNIAQPVRIAADSAHHDGFVSLLAIFHDF